ncbi:NCA2-domain-containing protein [Leucogyrophana mollusca]|uniref:NCA2-domain-containing protein n=1 Tax=Leucogyrophana mollusca TaxID=85980 RepID=A0ACB8BTS6_9AGAM|nr:NCA2-domain-containing protein [Leucogyrophana mollusca]
MNSFSSHYTECLAALTTSPLLTNAADSEDPIRSLDSCLKLPFSESSISKAIDILDDIERRPLHGWSQPPSNEEYALQRAVFRKIVLGIYANALDLYLSEANTAQNDAEWWAEIEQSRQYTALYLLQTLPTRLLRVLRVIRAQNIPLRPSTFYPSSLRQLFPAGSTFRPGVLTTTLFPYLNARSSSKFISPPSPLLASPWVHHPYSVATFLGTAYHSVRRCVHGLYSFFYFPLRLAREECHLKRKELQKLRNERAEVLGKLVSLRPQLAIVLESRSASATIGEDHPLAEFLNALAHATSIHQLPSPSGAGTTHNIQMTVQLVHAGIFTSHRDSHNAYLDTQDLRRPSRLALLWPRLFLLPPLGLYCVRCVYASRASLMELAQDTIETARDFFKDWLLEPVKEIVKTIRTGGEDGVIVRKEAIAADLDSLERMTLALVQHKLGYNEEQLAELSRRIRLGDLTAVLKIYEEDIKSPMKSAVAGTLLRTAFVQIQKAKVDIDQALAGIDKLLKSQELTFAFVGVAPAFAVVYVAGKLFKSLFSGGGGKYGGKHRRTGTWLAMRRIERLLVFQPKSTHGAHRHLDSSQTPNEPIPPLTSGLLVLSVTHLREYALASLPARSRLREGFLEDVQDLEDPSLGRAEKLRVIDRMWKNWGEELGWFRLAAGRRSR